MAQIRIREVMIILRIIGVKEYWGLAGCRTQKASESQISMLRLPDLR